MVSLDGKKTMQHSQGKSYAELARKRLKSLCVNHLTNLSQSTEPVPSPIFVRLSFSLRRLF